MASHLYFGPAHVPSQESPEEAVELLRRAVALDPRNPKLGVHLASVLIDQRNAEAATPLIERQGSRPALSRRAARAPLPHRECRGRR